MEEQRPPLKRARYEEDMWTEVAKHLCGCDLVCLSLTCNWFRRLVADDSIWRYAFIRNLLPPVAFLPPHPSPPHHSWRRLYAAAFDWSHSYCFREREKHIDWLRIGGFLLDTPCVLLTAKLPLPKWLPPGADCVQLAIQMTGTCVLTNARPGIWIADRHLVRCGACSLKNCEGTLQVLDVRHHELFLEEGYRDGTWEYEDLGEHFDDEEAAAAAFCAIINGNHLFSPFAAFVLNAESWIRKRHDLRPKACVTKYAAAVNSYLKSNTALLSKFQVVRDTTRDGQIVSIRITQQLLRNY
ncbi:hypothetical protein QOZ80_5AG0362930 [Eleusine coracana subsp. coracana]|nr:hypothetical protein QOZ80_5AG0362930 [Eleusine coracana subsp. coracana]